MVAMRRTVLNESFQVVEGIAAEKWSAYYAA
jgi:hypothetical protein